MTDGFASNWRSGVKSVVDYPAVLYRTSSQMMVALWKCVDCRSLFRVCMVQNVGIIRENSEVNSSCLFEWYEMMQAWCFVRCVQRSSRYTTEGK
jgi:hypothetical protein